MLRTKFQEFLKIVAINQREEEFLQDRQKKITEMTASAQFKRELAKFNALSNKIRFLIYQLLLLEDLCTCALARILKVSESTITHHLKILEKAGLIIGVKKGYFTLYTTRNSHLESVQLATY